jgi:hypothetical protein
MNWIKRHFRRYLERSPWDFCWRIALEHIIVGAVVLFILAPFGLPHREINVALRPLFWQFVVGAPIIETLIFQAFPVWIARICKVRFSVQVLVSTVPFAIDHALIGIQTGIAAGLVGGFYFAFTYAHWRKHRRWTAFWVTAVSHAICNGIGILLAWTLGQI